MVKKLKSLEEHADTVNNSTETDKLRSDKRDLLPTRPRLSRPSEPNSNNTGNNKKKSMDSWFRRQKPKLKSML